MEVLCKKKSRTPARGNPQNWEFHWNFPAFYWNCIGTVQPGKGQNWELYWNSLAFHGNVLALHGMSQYSIGKVENQLERSRNNKKPMNTYKIQASSVELICIPWARPPT